MIPNAASPIAKFLLDVGMGKVGSVTAIATARQADTEGTWKAQFSALTSLMHGYAVANRTKIPGAMKMAQRVPMP